MSGVSSSSSEVREATEGGAMTGVDMIQQEKLMRSVGRLGPG
jgi:hypothetical protein